MQYSIVAAGLIATAYAAVAPTYEAPPVYSAPALNTTVVVAPVYPVSTKSAPVYVVSSSKEVPVYTTKVVDSYTTYCPGPTTLTYNSKTYTVTSATTLTITNCPCTITAPVYTAPAQASAPPAVVVTKPVTAPVYTAPAAAPAAPKYTAPAAAPAGNATKPATTAPVAYTGAASAVSAGAAGLLAVFGLVAAL